MTVEWRIHGGTTDWSKIRAWVLATQRWVEHAVKRSCHFKADALAAIKAMATKRANSADATHEHRCFADTISQLEFLEEALEAWG